MIAETEEGLVEGLNGWKDFVESGGMGVDMDETLSLIHISEPTRPY